MSKALHFKHEVPVTVRFSANSGIPKIADADPRAAPRGLAIKFRLPDAGLSYYDAATEVSFDPYTDWIDSERIVINVASLYREYGMKEQPTVLDLWTDMLRFHRAGLCNCGRKHTGSGAT